MEREIDLAISESEAARRLSVSIGALRKWRRESKGPRFIKLGRLVRYSVGSLQAWLEANSRNGEETSTSTTGVGRDA